MYMLQTASTTTHCAASVLRGTDGAAHYVCAAGSLSGLSVPSPRARTHPQLSTSAADLVAALLLPLAGPTSRL